MSVFSALILFVRHEGRLTCRDLAPLMNSVISEDFLGDLA